MRKKSVEVCLIALIVIILYTVFDVVFGIIKPLKPYASNPERLTAKAYLNEPYFSEDFLVESFVQPGGWESPEGTKLILPQEFHGKYFNVDILPPTNLTYRRTINHISDQALKNIKKKNIKIIIILGGSTVYCSEVPDDLTIASFLSKRLTTSHPEEEFYILNAGVTSANSSQELQRLKYELDRGLRPDIVISYNGINDITNGIYFGDPDGVMFCNDKRNRLKETIRKIISLNFYYYMRKKSESETQRRPPDHITNMKMLESLAYKTKENYKANILKMHDLSKVYNFRLIIMLQPNLYTTNPSNNKESIAEIKRLAELRTPKIGQAFSIGYPLLRKEILEIGAEGVEAFDISNIFNLANQDVFIDMLHVNSGGNKIVAESMEKILTSRL
jgi:lysophospholipase L1-like esterase